MRERLHAPVHATRAEDSLTWTHDALAADLLDGRHLAGEIAIEKLALRAGIVDIAAMRLSWSQPRLTVYEVKISRADFLSDVRSGKWRKYLGQCERLYFAVPAGLVDKREIPPECGLTMRGDRGWYTPRAAPRRTVEPIMHQVFVQSLLFRHYAAPWDGAARTRAMVIAKATTPPCATCGHPMGRHPYGWCRCGGCDCYVENWRQLAKASAEATA